MRSFTASRHKGVFMKAGFVLIPAIVFLASGATARSQEGDKYDFTIRLKKGDRITENFSSKETEDGRETASSEWNDEYEILDVFDSGAAKRERRRYKTGRWACDPGGGIKPQSGDYPRTGTVLLIHREKDGGTCDVKVEKGSAKLNEKDLKNEEMVFGTRSFIPGLVLVPSGKVAVGESWDIDLGTWSDVYKLSVPVRPVHLSNDEVAGEATCTLKEVRKEGAAVIAVTDFEALLSLVVDFKGRGGLPEGEDGEWAKLSVDVRGTFLFDLAANVPVRIEITSDVVGETDKMRRGIRRVQKVDYVLVRGK